MCADRNDSGRLELSLCWLRSYVLAASTIYQIADTGEIRARETGVAIYLVCCQSRARAFLGKPSRCNLVLEPVKFENGNVNSIPPTDRTLALIDKSARAFTAGSLCERLTRNDFEAAADPVVRFPSQQIGFHSSAPNFRPDEYFPLTCE
jgi:hypothetical protein